MVLGKGKCGFKAEFISGLPFLRGEHLLNSTASVSPAVPDVPSVQCALKVLSTSTGLHPLENKRMQLLSFGEKIANSVAFA